MNPAIKTALIGLVVLVIGGIGSIIQNQVFPQLGKAVEGRLKSIESGTKNAESRAANAESKAEDAESKAEDAESKAAKAESRAAKAESRAAKAESKAEIAGSKAEIAGSKAEDAKKTADFLRESAIGPKWQAVNVAGMPVGVESPVIHVRKVDSAYEVMGQFGLKEQVIAVPNQDTEYAQFTFSLNSDESVEFPDLEPTVLATSFRQEKGVANFADTMVTLSYLKSAKQVEVRVAPALVTGTASSGFRGMVLKSDGTARDCRIHFIGRIPTESSKKP